MSVQKLHIVQKSRKDQGKCGNCGDPLPAGTAYRWWPPGFRMRSKNVRCMKTACTPRQSERETTKAATVMARQEAAEYNMPELDSPEDIEAEVREVGDAAREVADEYQAGLDEWEHGNEQLQEKVETYEAAADELENWSWDGTTDYELCDDHKGREDETIDLDIQECPDCQVNRDEWLDECREAALDAINDIELGQ